MLETPLCEIGSTDDLYYHDYLPFLTLSGDGALALPPLPFLTLSGDGVLALPPDFVVSRPITLPQPLPLGVGDDVTNYTTAYVSHEPIYIVIRSGL